MRSKHAPEAVVHTSLGLNTLCQKLQGSTDLKILELGPARGGNIEFWSQFCSSVFVADLGASLPLPRLAEDQERTETEWKNLLGLPEGCRFDVILFWDLLNYIELTSIPSLVGYLSRFCRPGTILFSLIFDHSQMPEEITVYRIVDPSHLSYEISGPAMRACPRHQPRALTGALRGFRTSESFRLRNSVVEYLFAYEEEKSTARLS